MAVKTTAAARKKKPSGVAAKAKTSKGEAGTRGGAKFGSPAAVKVPQFAGPQKGKPFTASGSPTKRAAGMTKRAGKGGLAAKGKDKKGGATFGGPMSKKEKKTSTF